MTRDELYNHYKTFYAPNNAIVVAAGDFDTERLLERIEESFGSIPAGPPIRPGQVRRTGAVRRAKGRG